MNEFTTPLNLHYENFNQKDGNLLPAFIRWNCEKNDFSEINPKKNIEEIRTALDFGDNWSDELESSDERDLNDYFQKFYHLKHKLAFLLSILNHNVNLLQHFFLNKLK